jgi:hypothetical protein
MRVPGAGVRADVPSPPSLEIQWVGGLSGLLRVGSARGVQEASRKFVRASVLPKQMPIFQDAREGAKIVAIV